MFTKSPNSCDREDIHNCRIAIQEIIEEREEVGRPNLLDKKTLSQMDNSFCLQITLRLPAIKDDTTQALTQATTLLVTGPNQTRTHLYCGDSNGRVTIWEVPPTGFDYIPSKSWKPHQDSVTCMVSTRYHLITGSNDGNIMLHSLKDLRHIRTLNILEWCVFKSLITDLSVKLPRMVKCMHIIEDGQAGGSLVVGTSYGDCMVMFIGTQV